MHKDGQNLACHLPRVLKNEGQMQHLTGVCRRCRCRVTSKAFVAIAIVTGRPCWCHPLTAQADRPTSHVSPPRTVTAILTGWDHSSGRPATRSPLTAVHRAWPQHRPDTAVIWRLDEPADFICKSLFAQLTLHLGFLRPPSNVLTTRLSLQSHQLINEPSLSGMCVCASVTERSLCYLSFMYLSSKYQPSQQTELLSRHSVRSFNVQRPCKMQHSCSKLSPCICRHISWFCHIRYGGQKSN